MPLSYMLTLMKGDRGLYLITCAPAGTDIEIDKWTLPTIDKLLYVARIYGLRYSTAGADEADVREWVAATVAEVMNSKNLYHRCGRVFENRDVYIDHLSTCDGGRKGGATKSTESLEMRVAKLEESVKILFAWK